MKTIESIGAQGDVLFRRIDKLPEGAVEEKREQGAPIIVTHSETGHHHAIGKAADAHMFTKGDPLVAYLSIGEPYADVEHLRPWDTHETIRLPPGIFEVRRQREHTPEGWRRVED